VTNLFQKALCSGLLWSLLVIQINAEPCHLVDFLEERSSGTSILTSPCQTTSHLGLGSTIKVYPNGRVWLKGSTLSDTHTSIQLICQNNGNTPVLLDISSPLAPWISPRHLVHCNAWSEQYFSCYDNNMESPVFMCALAFIQQNIPGNHSIERTTSVKMRNIEVEKKTEHIERIISDIKPEIALCLKLLKLTKNKWSINAAYHKKIIELVIYQPTINTTLNACLSSIDKSIDYPEPWHLSVTYSASQ